MIIRFTLIALFFLSQIHAQNISETRFSEFLDRGDLHFTENNFEEALTVYETLLKQLEMDEKNSDLKNYKSSIVSRIAHSYAKLDKKERVLEFLNLQSNQLDSNTLVIYITLLKSKGNFEKAFQVIQNYLEQFSPDSEPALFWHYGDLCLKRGLIDQAEKTFDMLANSENNAVASGWGELGLVQIDTYSQQMDKAFERLNHIKRRIHDEVIVDYTKTLEADLLFQQRRFKEAEQLYADSSHNRKKLALCQLAQKCLSDPDQVYEMAERLIEDESIFSSQLEKREVILLLAELGPINSTQDPFQQWIKKEEGEDKVFSADLLFSRGLHHLRESEKATLSSKELLTQSVKYFTQAYDLYRKNNRTDTALECLKYIAISYHMMQDPHTHEKALNLLTKWEKTHGLPDELLYLEGILATTQHEQYGDHKHLELAKLKLTECYQHHPKGKFADKALYQLGKLFYLQQKYPEATRHFISLIHQYPSSPIADEALLLAAYSIENLEGPSKKSKELLQTLYEKYPNSKWAPEAFFNSYSFSEYLQGDRSALLHLGELVHLFPNTPHTILAYYLIALDYKRTRLSESGKILRRRNLEKTLEHLKESELSFETTLNMGKIPDKDLEYFASIYFQSLIEKSHTYLAIAAEAYETKQEVYEHYAIDQLKELLAKLDKSNLLNSEKTLQLKEEAGFLYVHSLARNNQVGLALEEITRQLKSYQKNSVTRGYFLAKLHTEQGLLLKSKTCYKDAIHAFEKAEDAARGRLLSEDERLELAIQKGLCYQVMNDLDTAMRIFSQVINEDVISSKRVKAMLLRADVYTQQGRGELAQKQLEAVTKKGGEWAQKAKEKLEQTHGVL